MAEERSSRSSESAPAAPRRLRRRGKLRARNRRAADLGAAVRAGLAIGIGLQLVAAAFLSPRFDINLVEVKAGRSLDPSDLATQAGVPLSGNIFSINLAAIRRSFEENPVYRRARVHRLLPGTLRIELQERQPAAQVAAGSLLMNLDETGFAYESGKREEALPLLQLPRQRLPRIGESLEKPLFDGLMESYRLAKMAEVPIRRMAIDGRGEVWFHVSAANPEAAAKPVDFRIRVGRPTELAEKVSNIRQVLLARPDLPQVAQYLNVMCAGRPAYMRLAKESGNR